MPGKSGRLVLEGTLKGFVKAGKISEHDALIGRKLGNVLTGGEKGGPEAENLVMPIDHAKAVGGEPVIRAPEMLPAAPPPPALYISV